MVLFEMLVAMKLLASKTDDHPTKKKFAKYFVHEMASEHWRSLFRIEERRGRQFHDIVNTDGVSLSICYTRPHYKAKGKKAKRKPDDDPDAPSTSTSSKRRGKTKLEQPRPPWDPPAAEDRVIAIDPGRTNIVFGVEMDVAGGVSETYVLTRRRYRHEAHITKCTRIAAKWGLDVAADTEVLSHYSPKTASVQTFFAHLEILADNGRLERLWQPLVDTQLSPLHVIFSCDRLTTASLYM